MRVVADRLGRPFGDDAAEVQHGNALAQAHHETHVVLDHEDRVAARLDVFDLGHQVDLLAGVHAGDWLVEQQQLGLGGQRPREFELALVAIGEVVGNVMRLVVELDPREQLQRSIARAALGSAVLWQREQQARGAVVQMPVHAHHDVFQQRHLLEDADVLERACDAHLRDLVRLSADQVLAIERERPARGCEQAGDQIEHRRLAGAVRADQTEDAALRHVNVDVLQDRQAAKALGNGCEFEHGGLSAIHWKQPGWRPCQAWCRRA